MLDKIITTVPCSYHTKVRVGAGLRVPLPAGHRHDGAPPGRLGAVDLYQGVDAGHGASAEHLPGGEAPEPRAQVRDGAQLTQGRVVRRARVLKCTVSSQ